MLYTKRSRGSQSCECIVRLERVSQNAVALWSGCIAWARTVSMVAARTCPHALGVIQVSDEQMKELAVKTETTNPWYWGVRTLVKVGPVGLLPDHGVSKSFSHTYRFGHIDILVALKFHI